MRATDRERVLEQVVSRVTANELARADGERSLERVIYDTWYHERRRLEAEPRSREVGRVYARWGRLLQELRLASETRQRELLRDIVREFAAEIVGHFDQRVYRIATRVLPVGLSAMLNALSPKILLAGFPHPPGVADRIIIDGEVEQMRRLRARGTLILTPTHLSHMDSIVTGYALHEIGLPPFTYGAGLNLFTNPLISFFMHNLGAYKVDRKKKADLYKETLKEYATVTLELGYDNLFFPGGTRSRSGAVEQHLKLGLLGAGLRAYVNNLLSRRLRPNIYIVPCTINYYLVLEAETLIDDYLKEAGKARYIIEDDESTRPERVISFLRNLFQLDARIYLHFGRALDPFGNPVDDEGRSLDGNGRPIDIQRYTFVHGEPAHDAQRDAEYTRLLGEKLSEAFLRGNTVLPTHAVAFAAFELLARRNRGLDLYRLLRARGRDRVLGLAELHEGVERLQRALERRAAAGGLRVGAPLRAEDPEGVTADALRHFGIYHRRPVLTRRGDRVYPADMNLLLYYHNRLSRYGLEREVAP
ncbi:MAG TPA: 1-acyl-sn-glycerol-3-phosphate acyltransferase [Polyangia bacterium]|jgi:glycerol-3-phosphate O-acyltransferase